MFVCVRAYYIEQDNIQAKSKLYAALFQRDKISLCSRIQIIKMRKNFVGGAAAGRVFSPLLSMGEKFNCRLFGLHGVKMFARNRTIVLFDSFGYLMGLQFTINSSIRFGRSY